VPRSTSARTSSVGFEKRCDLAKCQPRRELAAAEPVDRDEASGVNLAQVLSCRAAASLLRP
jgi:hypothetical protein